jgi:hypothetical protein
VDKIELQTLFKRESAAGSCSIRIYSNIIWSIFLRTTNGVMASPLFRILEAGWKTSSNKDKENLSYMLQASFQASPGDLATPCSSVPHPTTQGQYNIHFFSINHFLWSQLNISGYLVYNNSGYQILKRFSAALRAGYLSPHGRLFLTRKRFV